MENIVLNVFLFIMLIVLVFILYKKFKKSNNKITTTTTTKPLGDIYIEGNINNSESKPDIIGGEAIIVGDNLNEVNLSILVTANVYNGSNYEPVIKKLDFIFPSHSTKTQYDQQIFGKLKSGGDITARIKEVNPKYGVVINGIRLTTKNKVVDVV